MKRSTIFIGTCRLIINGERHQNSSCEKIEVYADAGALVVKVLCNLRISMGSMMDSLLWLNSLKVILELLTRPSRVSRWYDFLKRVACDLLMLGLLLACG